MLCRRRASGCHPRRWAALLHWPAIFVSLPRFPFPCRLSRILWFSSLYCLPSATPRRNSVISCLFVVVWQDRNRRGSRAIWTLYPPPLNCACASRIVFFSRLSWAADAYLCGLHCHARHQRVVVLPRTVCRSVQVRFCGGGVSGRLVPVAQVC